jgi:large subunit ribosomal protein L25
MSDVLSLDAVARERAGKGASRSVRRQGRVPAVIYGQGQQPVSIHLEEKALVKMLSSGHFMNSVVELALDGATHRALPRDVQFHPVNDRPIHVDFLRVGASTEVSVSVPVRFENEEASPGLKAGGVLNIVRHDVEVTCPADAIPDDLVVDLTGTAVGDSIHISAVKLPAGVKTVIARDFTIATIAATKVSTADAAADAADAASSTEA